LIAGIGTPDVRAYIGARWAPAPDDRDGDRIPDAIDACPEVKEDYDYFEDGDGCPDEDRDNDGIEDKKDKCPDQPENPNDFEDDDGCPDTRAKVEKDRIAIRGNVLFEVGKAILKRESKQLLSEIAEVLKKNPQIEHVSIEGHTDSDGDAESNQILSQDRADAVRRYLVREGVVAKRLSATGYGESKPIASNDTKEGKAKNRRVEFLIAEEGDAAPAGATPPEAKKPGAESRAVESDETAPPKKESNEGAPPKP
jgi:outer membrane protein OmpA-like peptidoglycan-associated protein